MKNFKSFETIPKGTRVMVTEIGKNDAYFENAETIIGKIGTVISPDMHSFKESPAFYAGEILFDESVPLTLHKGIHCPTEMRQCYTLAFKLEIIEQQKK